MSVDTELRDPGNREQDQAPGDLAVAGSRSSRRRDALIVVVALLVGMGGVAGYGALTGSDDADTSAIIEGDLGAEPMPLAEPGGEVAAGTPAASPTDAVGQFLAAEASGDFAASYSVLTEDQRSQYGSAAAWTNAHADFLPVTGYEIVGERGDRVSTEVEYRSSLDEVVGLVPARASVEWVVVQEPGGWLVDFDASSVEPLYPDDADAPAAVSEWAQAHQECSEPEQYDGALVATADLRRAAETLCDSTARIATGDAEALDEFDASPFVSAFGTDAISWARAVPLRGPAELTVVVAPVDDRWLVVGLLPST